MAANGGDGSWFGLIFKLIGLAILLYGLAQLGGALTMMGGIEGDGLMLVFVTVGGLILLVGGGLFLLGRLFGGGASAGAGAGAGAVRSPSVSDQLDAARDFQKSRKG